MKRILLSALCATILGSVAISVQARESAVIRFENSGPRVVGLNLFAGEALCDLTPDGRGVTALGQTRQTPTRRAFSAHDAFTRQHIDRDVEVGKPIEFVFRRPVTRAARSGIVSADVIGVRTLLVPKPDTEYRASVLDHGMRLDALIESRPRGSNEAFTVVNVEQSRAFRDLCVRGTYASR